MRLVSRFLSTSDQVLTMFQVGLAEAMHLFVLAGQAAGTTAPAAGRNIVGPKGRRAEGPKGALGLFGTYSGLWLCLAGFGNGTFLKIGSSSNIGRD